MADIWHLLEQKHDLFNNCNIQFSVFLTNSFLQVEVESFLLHVHRPVHTCIYNTHAWIYACMHMQADMHGYYICMHAQADAHATKTTQTLQSDDANLTPAELKMTTTVI